MKHSASSAVACLLVAFLCFAIACDAAKYLVLLPSPQTKEIKAEDMKLLTAAIGSESEATKALTGHYRAFTAVLSEQQAGNLTKIATVEDVFEFNVPGN